MADLMEQGSEKLAAFISAVANMRYEKMQVSSLREICMQCLAANESLFLTPVTRSNPFQYLPKSICKSFMGFLHKARKEKRKFAAAIYLDFLLLLLNAQLTEFDFTILADFVDPENEPFERIKMTSVTLHHLQKNCPKVEWLRLYWPRNFQLHLPWHNLTQWRTLRFLGVKDFICDAKTICTIMKNHPLLEGLEVAILLEELNSECVGFLSEMKQLQFLSLLVTKHDSRRDDEKAVQQIPNAMANIASRTPKLSTFHFHYNHANHPTTYPDGFVEKFATLRRDPEQRLQLLELALGSLNCSWPSNLHVEKLVICCLDDLRTVNNLKTAAGKVRSLVLIEIPTGPIYKLLRIFGPSIKQLGINYRFPKGLDANLNVFKVISLCPNLEKLFMDEFASQEMTSDCRLTPENFRGWRSFYIYKHNYENIYVTNRTVLRQVFKMFLLGAREPEPTLHVFIGEMLDAVVEALEEDPECLSGLKGLQLDLQWSFNLPALVKVLTNVVRRAPLLERICIGTGDGVRNEDVRLPHWFSEAMEKFGVSVIIEGVHLRDLKYEKYSDFNQL